MGICNSCLFYDDEGHIWRFYVNDHRDLMYSIMYGEDKWTKESKINNEVLDFTVNFDIDNRIYIIYSVRSGCLKYCVWEQNNWFGKTIYSLENEGVEMTELNVISIGNLMHIFFIEKNNIKKVQCSLMHLCLNKDENSFSTVDTIPFLKEVFCHYEVQSSNKGSLYLIFIKYEKDDIAINFTEYKNNKWSIPRRLYGVTGNILSFSTLLYSDKINIMNISKDDSLYSLEHVVIDSNGKMRSYKIHESSNEPSNSLLVEISGVLFAIWVEGKDVLASSYKNQWSEPFKYYMELDNEILIYKYLSLSDKYNNIKCKYILGTNPPEMRLILPEYKNNDYSCDVLESSKGESITTLEFDAEQNKLDIQKELLVLQKTNKNLEKKLIELQIKYQQKLRILEESGDNFFKLTNSNKKTQEKLNIITEIQQVTLKELEELRTEKVSKDILISDLNNKIQHLNKEYEALSRQKTYKDDLLNEIVNKLQQITSENERLWQDLKYEKNKGIVDRILNKKPER